MVFSFDPQNSLGKLTQFSVPLRLFFVYIDLRGGVLPVAASIDLFSWLSSRVAELFVDQVYQWLTIKEAA